MKKLILAIAFGFVCLLSEAADLTIYATPSASVGSNGVCPGGYVGYASYYKAAPDWGWQASTNTTQHCATDTNRTDTKIVFLGRLSGPAGCVAQTGCVATNLPIQKYRFTVYFPNNLPTNSYPLNISGFNP